MKGFLIKTAVLAILAVTAISCQDDTGPTGGELLLAAVDAPVTYRESLYDGEGELQSVSDVSVYSGNILARENQAGLYGLPYDLHQPWNYAVVRISVSSGSDRAWLTGDDFYACPYIQSEMFHYLDRIIVNQLVYDSDGKSVSSRIEYQVLEDRMVRANLYSPGADTLFNTADDTLERFILYSYDREMRLVLASEWLAESRDFVMDIVWEYGSGGRILSIKKYSSHTRHDEKTLTGNHYRFEWKEQRAVEVFTADVRSITGRVLFDLNADGTVAAVIRYSPGEDAKFGTGDDVPERRSYIEYQDGMRSTESVFAGDGSNLLFYRIYEY